MILKDILKLLQAIYSIQIQFESQRKQLIFCYFLSSVLMNTTLCFVLCMFCRVM